MAAEVLRRINSRDIKGIVLAFLKGVHFFILLKHGAFGKIHQKYLFNLLDAVFCEEMPACIGAVKYNNYGNGENQ